MSDNENIMYNMICNKRFDKLEAQGETIITILKGTNGTPGLCERIRTLETQEKEIISENKQKIDRRSKVLIGVSIVILAQMALQSFEWIARFF